MSVAISVDIVSDDASPALEALQDVLDPEFLHDAIAKSSEIVVRRHLRENGPNKKGWPTTRFWQRAAALTTSRSDEDAAVVSVNLEGVRQRYHGGPIYPVNKRALTIPISREAYGKVASDFDNAFLIETPKGKFIVRPNPNYSKEAVKRAKKREAKREWFKRLQAAERKRLGYAAHTKTKQEKKWHQSVSKMSAAQFAKFSAQQSKGPSQKRIESHQRLQWLFLLSDGVNQKPDPSVIPDDETLTQDAMDAVSRAVEEALK